MLNAFHFRLFSVIRCKDLYRQNGGAINAYVKVRDDTSRIALKI